MSNFKKLFPKILIWLCFIVPIIILGLNSVAYEGYFFSKTNINGLFLIVVCLLVTAIFKLMNKSNCKDSLKIFSLAALGLGLSLMVYFLMFALEQLLFENFVFSTIHIQPAQFGWLMTYFSIFCLVLAPAKVWHRYQKFIMLTLPLLVTLNGLFIRLSHKKTYFNLIAEDQLVEYATVAASLLIVYWAGKSLLIVTGQKQTKRALKYLRIAYCSLAIIAALFVAGEEISWGQRLLGLDTPKAFKEANLQEEINFHNLPVVFRYFDNISLYGSLYFAASWLIFGLVNRIVNISKDLQTTIKLWVSPWYLTFWFWLTPIYIALRYRHGIWSWTELGEPGEMYLMVGLALTWMRNYQQIRLDHTNK